MGCNSSTDIQQSIQIIQKEHPILIKSQDLKQVNQTCEVHRDEKKQRQNINSTQVSLKDSNIQTTKKKGYNNHNHNHQGCSRCLARQLSSSMNSELKVKNKNKMSSRILFKSAQHSVKGESKAQVSQKDGKNIKQVKQSYREERQKQQQQQQQKVTIRQVRQEKKMEPEITISKIQLEQQSQIDSKKTIQQAILKQFKQWKKQFQVYRSNIKYDIKQDEQHRDDHKFEIIKRKKKNKHVKEGRIEELVRLYGVA